MLCYTWKRILTGILSLFVLVTVTFFLVRLIPGSPFRQGGVSEQVVETIEREYGLNEPVLTQYFSYIGNVLRGDLGVSYQDPATRVTEIIARAWPVTASIGITALAVSVLLGTGLGILRAVTKRRFVRELISAGGMLAAGIPGFAAAILLLLVFSVKLKWLPASGLLSPAHYILPVTALSLYPAAMIARLVGNTLDSELQKDYDLKFQELDWKMEKDPQNGDLLDEYLDLLNKYLASGIPEGKERTVKMRTYSDMLERKLEETGNDLSLMRRKTEADLQIGEYEVANEEIRKILEQWDRHEAGYLLLLKYYSAIRNRAGIDKTIEMIGRKRIHLSPEGRQAVRFWQKK